MPATVPRVFTANNGSSKLNAFESELAAQPKAVCKSELKKKISKEARKKMIRQWQRGCCDRMSLAKRYAASSGIRLISVLADLEEKKTNETKKAIKKLKDELTLARWGADSED
jgi:hypothetical protein